MKPRAVAASTLFHRGNRWLVVGIAATVALVLVVLLSLTGVIGGGDTRRDAVAAYIEDVNALQREFGIERDRVGKVFLRARTDPNGLAGQVADLDRSAATLRDFDRRLRGLEAPAEARELRRRLLRMSAGEATFAMELARLGRYLPALAAERLAVGRAGATLERELAAKTAAAAQATAFDTFAAGIRAAAKPLQSASVPAALRPAQAEELARTNELSASARSLAAALRTGSGADAQSLIQRLIQRFSRAAAGSGNAVERKAVIALNAQARRIDTLRLAVAKERSRLDRVLD